MKKIISLFLSAIIIVSIAAVSVGNVSAKSKKFFANKKSITVTSGKQKTVKITSKKGKKLTYKVLNNKVCTAKFGKWKGKKITLTIKGKNAGKTKVTITNKKTKKKIKISVTVKSNASKKTASKTSAKTSATAPKIELPKTPLKITNTYFDVNNPREETITVSKIWIAEKEFDGILWRIKLCIKTDKKDGEVKYTLYGDRGIDIYLPIESKYSSVQTFKPDSVDYQYSTELYLDTDQSYKIELTDADVYPNNYY